MGSPFDSIFQLTKITQSTAYGHHFEYDDYYTSKYDETDVYKATKSDPTSDSSDD